MAEKEKLPGWQQNAVQKSRAAAKRKKTGKRIALALLAASLAAGGGMLWQYRQGKQDDTERELRAGTDQKLWYGQITEITGNEMELCLGNWQEENGYGQFTAGKEEKCYQIPVGTQVQTRLGAVTTFSRLAAGDIIAVLAEEDGADGCILKIQIMQ